MQTRHAPQINNSHDLIDSSTIFMQNSFESAEGIPISITQDTKREEPEILKDLAPLNEIDMLKQSSIFYDCGPPPPLVAAIKLKSAYYSKVKVPEEITISAYKTERVKADKFRTTGNRT
jgi:hypothetical protein